MSKIIKHTFVIPNLKVEHGELVEGKNIEKTYQFTLLFRGLGIYEEVTGRPLISDLLDTLSKAKNDTKNIGKFIDINILKTLACCSYVKIENDKFHNNRATYEEFKKSQVFPFIEKDFAFITKLVEMALDCVYNEAKSKNSEAYRSKK